MKMTTKKRVASITAAVAITAGMLAVPASAASNQEAITFGIGHSLTPADVAPALGRYRAPYDGQVYPNYRSTWSVCSLGLSGSGVGFDGTETEIRLRFIPVSAASKQNLSQSIFQFTSAAKAKNTFAKLQRDVRGCTGSFSTTPDPDAPANMPTWAGSYTNGTLNAAAGVPTIYVDYDWTRSLGNQVEDRVNEYSTYSLVNNAIIGVFYQRTPDGKATAREREGARVTTRSAIGNYQRQAAPKAATIQGRFATNSAALLNPKDVPAALGKRWKIEDQRFDATRQRIWICDPRGVQFGDANDQPARARDFYGVTADPAQVVRSLGGGANDIQQAIYDFGSSAKAKSAFTRLQRDAKRCNGTTVESFSGAGDGDGEPFAGTTSRTYRNAADPAVVVNGTPAISVDLRQVTAFTTGQPTGSFGVFGLWVLDGQRVVFVNLYGASGKTITNAQRAGVQELAKRAVARLH